ncbi:MAG: ferric reductase-like transmembrane domain-containing protein [Gemmatimonadetes bacterium]|nr:ferric reductase-like transmembrane domain-containing protein [Gemmatimonadota bacterium]
MSSYWVRRLRRHALFALAAVAMTAIVYAGVPSNTLRRLTLGTGYAGLAFLGATLVIGPWNVLMARANPVSMDLRRDTGIWAGILALVHTLIGLTVHMQGRFWLYFVYPPNQPHRIPLRHDPFGIANYAGLVATLVLILLLALSNDLALRRLGTHRWKTLQRCNYAGFALVAVHTAIFQIATKRPFPAVGALAATLVVVAATQLLAYRKRRASAA